MVKKNENKKEYTVFYNKKGEKVEPFEIKKKEGECKNTIDFCCIADVPDGFTLDIKFLDLCVDISDLKCCLETKTVETTVNNPCDGELTCLVDIQAVRLVGCVRVTASTGPLKAIKNPFIFEDNCAISCDTTVCVDQILDFTCDQIPPCDPCYEVVAVGAVFVPFIDECGREAVKVEGEMFLDFIGCDEPA